MIIYLKKYKKKGCLSWVLTHCRPIPPKVVFKSNRGEKLTVTEMRKKVPRPVLRLAEDVERKGPNLAQKCQKGERNNVYGLSGGTLETKKKMRIWKKKRKEKTKLQQKYKQHIYKTANAL